MAIYAEFITFAGENQACPHLLGVTGTCILYFNFDCYMMKLSVFSIAIPLLMASCATTGRLTYFSDMQPESVVAVGGQQEICLRPGDKITVVVSSKDQKLADLFNLTDVAAAPDSGGGERAERRNALMYTVDSDGNIDFPVMGLLHVGGFSRDSVAKYIKAQLVSRQLLTDAVVNVEFSNLFVAVLGEVRNPGRYHIERDWFTVIDAISMAGDLTTNGDRSNVLVMRREGNVRRAYRIDLRSGASVYSSPAYYLRQTDIVYIEPLRARRGK